VKTLRLNDDDRLLEREVLHAKDRTTFDGRVSIMEYSGAEVECWHQKRTSW
jgi:hypothetical protein